MSQLENNIDLIFELVFTAGRWQGQVDLEKHYDREQYATAAVESIWSRKTTKPLHESSSARSVNVNLRSEQWRDGVEKSAKGYLKKAKEILILNLLENKK